MRRVRVVFLVFLYLASVRVVLKSQWRIVYRTGN